MDTAQTHFFDRQIKLDLVGVQGQEKLLDAKVLVIGAGGLGCSVIESLARSGVGHMTIVDFDNIELTNLHRQVLFTEDDLGKSKSKVAQSKALKIAPWIKVEFVQDRFDVTNANEIFTDHDLIIDCTDHMGTKFFIHDFAYEKRVNLVQSSIHKFDGQLQTFHFETSTDKGCLRCLWEEEPDQLADCNDNGVMGVVPGIFGMLQANEAIKILLDMEGSHQNEVVTFNLLNLELNKLKYQKNTECKFCVQEERSTMKFFEVTSDDLKFDAYTWLDIRVSTKDLPLPAAIPADSVIIKTETEIIGEIPDFPQDKPFLILCDKGFRSTGLAKMLREFGSDNVFSLIGGYDAIKE